MWRSWLLCQRGQAWVCNDFTANSSLTHSRAWEKWALLWLLLTRQTANDANELLWLLTLDWAGQLWLEAVFLLLIHSPNTSIANCPVTLPTSLLFPKGPSWVIKHPASWKVAFCIVIYYTLFRYRLHLNLILSHFNRKRFYITLILRSKFFNLLVCD